MIVNGVINEYFSFIFTLSDEGFCQRLRVKRAQTHNALLSSKPIASLDSLQVESMLRTCRMSA